MGRSSAAQAVKNRARIVRVASKLFRARGIEAVSVAEIMTAADMTVGGFYKHFASKDALVQEATALAFDDALGLWKRLLDKDDTLDALRAKLVAEYLRPDPPQHCPIIAFAPYVASQGASPAAARYGEGTGALLDIFQTGNPADEAAFVVAQADPDLLLVFAAMVGARVLGEAAGPVAWVDAIKHVVVENAVKPARNRA